MTYKHLNSKIACYGNNKISNCFSMVSEIFACNVLLLKITYSTEKEAQEPQVYSLP